MKTTRSNSFDSNAPSRRRRCRSSKDRGAVMVLALLGGFLIVGLIGYVFNTGRHAQLRQQTQSAADSAVISGAGYVARSFNTVAMNNVEISRLIAVVQMLDSVPLAIEYTLVDIRADIDSLERQVSRGTGDFLGDQTLNGILQERYDQERQLVELDRYFNGGQYDVREMTFYASEFGRGKLWQAMEALDAVSRATMEQLGELTQLTAIEAGRRNMPGTSGETLSALAPFDRGIVLDPTLDFDDFRQPVTAGRLPAVSDDEITNRGPYDSVFGWRSDQRESIEIPNPNFSPDTSPEPGGSPWSRSRGRDQRRNLTVGSTLLGYDTFGPWQWLGDVLRDGIDRPGVMENSQFVIRMNRMGGNKLNYLWPGSASQWRFLDPQWITEYEQVQRIEDAGTPRIEYTHFIQMYFTQRFVDDQPVGEERMEFWDMIRQNGPNGWERPFGLTDERNKVRNHVWEDTATTIGAEIGPTGLPTGRTERVEERWLYVWLGTNVGPDITLRDPNNFSSRADLPAPIDFDHAAMPRPVDGALGLPGSPFAFLGLAKQPNRAPMWGQLFNTSAYDGHVGIAQASVFNNHSWDLWTQMWHAQLEPVQEYSQWVNLIRSQTDLATGYEDLSVGELQELTDYLQSLESLAPIMLHH